MKNKYRLNKYNGGTLVEIIIVVSIVVVVLTAIISGTITSLSVSGYSSKKNQATKLAQEVIELSRRKARDESWSAFSSKGASGAGISWCVDANGAFTQNSTCPFDIENTFSRKVTYVVSGSSVEATVLVSWNEGANTRTSKIQTVFTQWKYDETQRF